MSENIESNRKQFPGEYSNFTVADTNVNQKIQWEPKSDYEKGGQYGKIRAYTWRSGHSVEIDETPGGERIRVIHPKGSYVEFQHTGDVIYRANNHSYEVVAGDKNLRVKGVCNIHVSGDANIKIDGNALTEIGGNQTTKIGGDWNVKVGGKIGFTAGSDIAFTAGGRIDLNK
jgi:hypothetical protein